VWGFDYCASCSLKFPTGLPLIAHVPEFKLLVMIVNEDGPDWVDFFDVLLRNHSDEVPAAIYSDMSRLPFQIVIGVHAFYYLVNGVSRAPHHMRYFPASYEHVGPPVFSVSKLNSIAKAYEKAGKIPEGLAMFDRLAGFPVGDAEYLRIWAALAMQGNELDLAASLLGRADAIEPQTKHAWQVVIPQLSKIQEVSPALEPPILKIAMIERFRRSQPEYQLSDHDLARVAGAVEREIWTADRVLGSKSDPSHHINDFLRWVLHFPPTVRDPLIVAYTAEGGSSFKISKEQEDHQR